MLGFCCRRFQSLVPSCRRFAVVDCSVTHFHYYQKRPPFIRVHPYSSKSSALIGSGIDEKDCSFTVSYLINSCGLSPEFAHYVSEKYKINFESTEKPDSVIKLLKNYGCSDTQVSIIFRKQPLMLKISADKNLLPKLEFFNSIGFSGTSLVQILCSNPSVLTYSLEKCIKPCYDILRSRLQVPIERLQPFFFDYNRVFSLKVFNIVAGNTLVLRGYGVPMSSYRLWVPHYFKALTFDSEKVKANVGKVISMGFTPSSATFMKALYVISVMDASKWLRKMEFYKKWGLTEDDILSAFRKCPLFLVLKEQNSSKKLDFYLNEMGCQPADLAGHPDLLTYSLEKRIIPRCSVIRVLRLKGLILKEDVSLLTTLKKNDKVFLEGLVIKYQEEVPELLSVFEGKTSLAELGFGIKRRDGMKQL